MKKTPSATKLLNISLAALLTAAGPSWAAPVDVLFEWNQSSPDPSTGTGTLVAKVNGIIFSAPMPIPVLNQKDMLLAGESFLTTGPNGEGVVGFGNGIHLDQPGSPFGFHIGWSGTVNLTASSEGVDYTLPVDLVFVDDDDYFYSATVFDNPSGIDIQGGVQRFAGWVGDDGDGHRHSAQNNQDYLAGQDLFQISAGGNLGNNGNDDNVGIGFALRNGTGEGSVFVADVAFGGLLQKDDSAILPMVPPEPMPRTEPLPPAAPFSIVLDIGPADQRLQSGHIPVPFGDPFNRPPSAGSNGGGLIDFPVDTGTGTTFLLSLSEADGSTNDIDWRDRGDSANAAADLVQLGEDFVKNNDGTIRLDLADLPPGTYHAISYHVDPDFAQSEEILTFVDGVLQEGAVGNANVETGGVDLLTTELVNGTASSFSFTSDGINPVTIVFDGTAALDTEVPLSGLSLTYVPEPSTALLCIVLTALGAPRGLCRRAATT